jgi:hypothetical protein
MGSTGDQPLMTWLGTLSPWDATWMACAWAISDHVELRLAIANALQSQTPIVGATFVLDQLIEDRDPGVRAAASRAAALRAQPRAIAV